MTPRRLLPALALAAVLALAACGSDEPTGVASQGPSTTSTTTGAIGKGSNGFRGSDGGASSSTTASTPAAPDPNSPVATEPGPDLPGAEPGMVATEVPNRHDLVDPRTVAPTELVPDAKDPTQVHVRFFGGVPACYGAEASVAETDLAVVVTLRTGSVPEAAATSCIDLAQFQQITLDLEAPLGDRTLEATPAP